jgi:hypothetical protein
MLALSWGSTVVIPLSWASVVALFVPVVTALITRYRAEGNRAPQAVVAFVLSGLLAVWTLLGDDVPNDTVMDAVSAFLGTFVPQLAVYLGLWQPIAHLNARLGPNTGI